MPTESQPMIELQMARQRWKDAAALLEHAFLLSGKGEDHAAELMQRAIKECKAALDSLHDVEQRAG